MGGEQGPVWICGLKTPGLEGISFNPRTCQSWPVSLQGSTACPGTSYLCSQQALTPERSGDIPALLGPTHKHQLMYTLLFSQVCVVGVRLSCLTGRQTVCSTAPQERRGTWSLPLRRGAVRQGDVLTGGLGGYTTHLDAQRALSSRTSGSQQSHITSISKAGLRVLV